MLINYIVSQYYLICVIRSGAPQKQGANKEAVETYIDLTGLIFCHSRDPGCTSNDIEQASSL